MCHLLHLHRPLFVLHIKYFIKNTIIHTRGLLTAFYLPFFSLHTPYQLTALYARSIDNTPLVCSLDINRLLAVSSFFHNWSRIKGWKKMAACDNRGERLIVSLIDSYAVDDPDRAWASLPKDGEDLTKGFVDVNYKQFANAINHAAWWLEKQFPGRAGSFETLAYAGPKDVRYPILAVAAVKCGKQVRPPYKRREAELKQTPLGKQLLLPSPFATPEAQMHLLKTTNCSAYLHAHTLGPLVDSVLGKKSNFRRLEVPELDEWLSKENAPVFSYTKTWEQAKLDPWLIFHTSGTTGKISNLQKMEGVCR